MFKFKWSKGLEAIEDAYFIRENVFIKEQGFEDEFDEIDKLAHHITVYIDDIPIATARLFSENNNKEYHVGRVAVLKEYRGFNYGFMMMNKVIMKAKELSANRLILSSQKQAEPFYAKLGFKSFGEEYLDQFCPHISMHMEI